MKKVVLFVLGVALVIIGIMMSNSAIGRMVG